MTTTSKPSEQEVSQSQKLSLTDLQGKSPEEMYQILSGLNSAEAKALIHQLPFNQYADLLQVEMVHSLNKAVSRDNPD